MKTPGTYVKDYVRQHTDFTGIIWVETLVPKGRNGRKGLGNRRLEFWAAEGRAAASRSQYVRMPDWRDSYSLSNGRCQICGRMFFDRVLRFLVAPDPRAGEFIRQSRNVLYSCNQTEVRADIASVLACPGCISQHDLRHDSRDRTWSNDRIDDQRIVYRVMPHPILACFAKSPQVVIDLCSVVANLKAEPQITVVSQEYEYA